MATTANQTGARLLRCPGKSIGRIEEGESGLELVFGNGNRAAVVVSRELDAELRANLGKTVTLNGINMFDPNRLRTVEIIADSVKLRPPFDPEKFRQRMDRLAELLGPAFADVDPLKFGREDNE